MPIDSPRQLLAAVLRAEDPRPDRDLLGRFAATRDEEAFAELVRRHGRMVLAVTRRVTGSPHDAEDAFQAAFLVLARRAGQVARPDLLANWLYGVAYRTALEARNARRRIKEQHPVSAVPEPPDPRAPAAGGSPEDADLRRVIDEELAALPEKYRACVVLCDLEGLSRKDAAVHLRIPEGTLSSRLNHARKVLAGRLTRRGVTASGGALGAFLTGDALGAVVPARLALHTTRAAARFASGGAVPPEFASPHVTTLTNGVIQAMMLNRTRLVLGFLTVGLLTAGAAVGFGQFPARQNGFTPAGADPFVAQPPPPARDAKPPEKVPAKGVEDDDVPYPAFPVQAVVRLEENGKLMIRQRTRASVAVKKEVDGKQQVIAFEQQTIVTGRAVDASDVSVFDMKGNRVPDKSWKDKLKTDRLVLVSTDGRLPLPRDLQLVKDDTLLIVFPPGVAGAEFHWTPAPTTTYRRVQGPNGTTYYEPSTSYPTTPAIPPPGGVPSNTIPSPAYPPTVPAATPPRSYTPSPNSNRDAPDAPGGTETPTELPTAPSQVRNPGV
jgi:RNA polymerase sigma factor (sigma-70 family)